MAPSTSDSRHTPLVEWPDGKTFAFSIFDDTDGGSLDRIAPVYDLLRSLGLRTTKSVWPLQHPDAPDWAGPSCEDTAYRAWLEQLQADGFEIGYHGPTCGDNTREDHVRALELFRELFGHHPATFANHAESADALYWGDARVSGLARLAYRLMTRFKNRGHFKGHVQGSHRFWGDLCRNSIDFVRNFVYADINTLKACPQMPYADPHRPFVRAWFASSDGGHADSFVRLLSTANQDRLERQHGACIVYTHFTKEFVTHGALRDDVTERLAQLSQRNGWFVPTVDILRHLEHQHGGVHPLTAAQRRRLEWHWLRDKVFLGST